MPDITNPQGSELSASQAASNLISSQLEKVEQPPEPDIDSLTEQVAAEPEQEQEAAEEVEEAEAEPAEEAEEETEETDESEDDNEDPEEDEPQTIALPDGTEITVDEASQGYLRQADYTRKTQDLADKRKSGDAQLEQALGQIAQFANTLQKTFVGQEPDWAELAKTTEPLVYQQMQAEWGQKSQLIQSAIQAEADAKQQHMNRRVASTLETLQTGTFEPSWTDETKLKEGLDGLTQYLQGEGYTDEEINFLAVSPRLIMGMEKSRRFDELQKQKPIAKKKVSQKPRPQKAGSKHRQKSRTASAEAAKNQALRQPQQPLSVRDAVNIIHS